MNILQPFIKVCSDVFSISIEAVDTNCSQILIKILINCQHNFETEDSHNQNNSQKYFVFQQIISFYDVVDKKSCKLKEKSQQKSIIFLKLQLQSLLKEVNQSVKFSQIFYFTKKFTLKKVILGSERISKKFQQDLKFNQLFIQNISSQFISDKQFILMKITKTKYNDQMLIVLPKLINSQSQNNAILTPLKKEALDIMKKQKVIKKLFFSNPDDKQNY